MPDLERVQQWCGVCFAWRERKAGRCVVCGNAHMRGMTFPVNEARDD